MKAAHNRLFCVQGDVIKVTDRPRRRDVRNALV